MFGMALIAFWKRALHTCVCRSLSFGKEKGITYEVHLPKRRLYYSCDLFAQVKNAENDRGTHNIKNKTEKLPSAEYLKLHSPMNQTKTIFDSRLF